MPKELGGRDGPEPVRYGDWEKKDKHYKVKVGRYVPFNDGYVLDTTTGEVFKPEVK